MYKKILTTISIVLLIIIAIDNCSINRTLDHIESISACDTLDVSISLNDSNTTLKLNNIDNERFN